MSEASTAALRARVGVAGLWHLGSVIAACVADEEWPVVAVDPDPDVVTRLRHGRAPLLEPGLDALVQDKQHAGWLRFERSDTAALGDAEIIWVAFDTPVDDEDQADVASVADATTAILDRAAPDALVVVSSQLPVGSVATLAARMSGAGRGDLRWACVPENLRLGRAIETFSAADRFVAGVRSERERRQLQALLGRFTGRIEWMGIESAEMTKHALNAFLATSVSFINEIAAICERVGADAAEVARGLKSEQRIGPRAYLAPGDAFAGGTLARDIAFLRDLARREGLPADVVSGVAAGNENHRAWARRTLEARFTGGGTDAPGLSGRRVALWGLTYKPQTSTLRRSSAIEVARWLTRRGAHVSAYDPAIEHLPPDVDVPIEVASAPLAAARDADALVVSTPWPEFREVSPEDVADAMRDPLVLDAGGFLQGVLGGHANIRYVRVGAPSR